MKGELEIDERGNERESVPHHSCTGTPLSILVSLQDTTKHYKGTGRQDGTQTQRNITKEQEDRTEHKPTCACRFLFSSSESTCMPLCPNSFPDPAAQSGHRGRMVAIELNPKKEKCRKVHSSRNVFDRLPRGCNFKKKL